MTKMKGSFDLDRCSLDKNRHLEEEEDFWRGFLTIAVTYSEKEVFRFRYVFFFLKAFKFS